MEQKNITGYEKEYESKQHPDIKGVQIIEGKNNFPISWLNQQGYVITGPISEEYIISPVDVANEENHITKVIIPIEKTE